MKKIEKQKKTYCDFCEKEIPAKEQGNVIQEDEIFPGYLVGVAIRLQSTDPEKRRLITDFCRACILKAVASIGIADQEVKAAATV